MATTVRQVRAEARRRAATGDLVGALQAYDHLLAANPLDYGCRLRIADTLEALGNRDDAIAVYASQADHDLRSGHPLPAVVACKALDRLRADSAALVTRLGRVYGLGSTALGGFTARQAPVDLGAEIPEPTFDESASSAEVAARVRDRALDLTAFIQYPTQFLPIPFLSELPPPLLAAVVDALSVRRLAPGDLVVREGDPGEAFYLLATGEARVFNTDGVGVETELARIHENALFGEMALLTGQPRTASVQAVDETDVLELSAMALADLTGGRPQLAEILDGFSRQRLLKNLLAASPLFRPFSREQQLDLIRHFEGHDVAVGTEIIREGDVGLGLYAVLSGEVEVVKLSEAGEEVLLARLTAGDLFGEMSLLADKPTNATVRAAVPTTILFLAREYFRRLTDALPDLRRYFEELSERRHTEIRLVLGEDERGDEGSGGGRGRPLTSPAPDPDGEPPPVLV